MHNGHHRLGAGSRSLSLSRAASDARPEPRCRGRCARRSGAGESRIREEPRLIVSRTPHVAASSPEVRRNNVLPRALSRIAGAAGRSRCSRRPARSAPTRALRRAAASVTRPAKGETLAWIEVSSIRLDETSLGIAPGDDALTGLLESAGSSCDERHVEENRRLCYPAIGSALLRRGGGIEGSIVRDTERGVRRPLSCRPPLEEALSRDTRQ